VHDQKSTKPKKNEVVRMDRPFTMQHVEIRPNGVPQRFGILDRGSPIGRRTLNRGPLRTGAHAKE
jgi:hypothetical protein